MSDIAFSPEFRAWQERRRSYVSPTPVNAQSWLSARVQEFTAMLNGPDSTLYSSGERSNIVAWRERAASLKPVYNDSAMLSEVQQVYVMSRIQSAAHDRDDN